MDSEAQAACERHEASHTRSAGLWYPPKYLPETKQAAFVYPAHFLE